MNMSTSEAIFPQTEELEEALERDFRPAWADDPENVSHLDVAYLPGYPGLIAQYSRDPFDVVERTVTVANQMREMGLPIVHAVAVRFFDETAPEGPHNGVLVAENVIGTSLEDVFAAHPLPKYVSEFDVACAVIARDAAHRAQHGGFAFFDIDSPDRYMLGGTASDRQNKVRLTHIPDRADRFVSNEDYGGRLLDLANNVLQVERHLDRRLERARLALREALELVYEHSVMDGVRFRHAILTVLEHNRHVDFTDLDEPVTEDDY